MTSQRHTLSRRCERRHVCSQTRWTSLVRGPVDAARTSRTREGRGGASGEATGPEKTWNGSWNRTEPNEPRDIELPHTCDSSTVCFHIYRVHKMSPNMHVYARDKGRARLGLLTYSSCLRRLRYWYWLKYCYSSRPGRRLWLEHGAELNLNVCEL